MRVLLVINNYFKEENAFKARQIVKVLQKYGKKQVKMRSYKHLRKGVSTDVEALILSGSPAHPWKEEHMTKFSDEINLVLEYDNPILGICFGHQLIGKAFGAQARILDSSIHRFESVEVIQPDDIFSTWKKGTTLPLCESHKDEITLPPDFIHLARSTSCENEAMQHPTRPIYSTQAHLERSTETYTAGFQVIKNFLHLFS
ncbi:MAG: GMP synthase [Candidatus Korarchaeota archaeon]|nr:GMP synthase [Candidatus Thorarchaeota archaeon]NIW51488.1 GMP synthase [Candidatus Korarchaeota archaeon]